MAIVVEDVQSNSGTSISTLDITSVVSQGANRVIFCNIAHLGTSISVSSVTFDPGGANEKAFSSVGNAANAEHKTEIFKVVAPAAVTATVRVTMSGTADELVAGTLMMSGVDQTTPNDTAATAAGINSPMTVDVSSETGDLVIDSAIANTTSITVGGSQTQRWNISPSTDSGAASTEAGAATVTMSWTFGGGPLRWATIGVNINAAAAAGSVLRRPIDNYIRNLITR